MHYELIRSDRKTVQIIVKADGCVVVKAPYYTAASTIQDLVDSKEAWIRERLAIIAQRPVAAPPTLTMAQVRQLTEAARKDLPPRVARYAAKIGVRYGTVTIGPQRAHWGFCSAKGNLRFNSLLMLCPEEVRDYIVVHELCHRTELNHLPPFWAEVAKVMPEYETHAQWLTEHGAAIIQRLP